MAWRKPSEMTDAEFETHFRKLWLIGWVSIFAALSYFLG